MRIVRLFGKPNCGLCDGWKRKLTHLGIEFQYFDAETVGGLAEMARNNCGRIPALAIGEIDAHVLRVEEEGAHVVKSERLLELVRGDA